MGFKSAAYLSVFSVLVGCSTGGSPSTSGPETSSDTGSTSEVSVDVGDTPPNEASIDSQAPDGGADATADAPPADEAGPADVGSEVLADAGTDGGADATAESGADATAPADVLADGTGAVDVGSEVTPDDSGADAAEVGLVCTPGAMQCAGDYPQYCLPDGAGWTNNGGVCQYGGGCQASTALCACTDSARFVTKADVGSPDGFSIYDTKTGLYWADADAKNVVGGGKGSLWSNAQPNCDSYGAKGVGTTDITWVVPSENQWMGILAQLPGSVMGGGDVEAISCEPLNSDDIDTIFKFMYGDELYWTSSSDGLDTSQGYAIDVGKGTIAVRPGAATRCVHD